MVESQSYSGSGSKENNAATTYVRSSGTHQGSKHIPHRSISDSLSPSRRHGRLRASHQNSKGNLQATHLQANRNSQFMRGTNQNGQNQYQGIGDEQEIPFDPLGQHGGVNLFDFLPELKQFISYFQLNSYFQGESSNPLETPLRQDFVQLYKRFLLIQSSFVQVHIENQFNKTKQEGLSTATAISFLRQNGKKANSGPIKAKIGPNQSFQRQNQLVDSQIQSKLDHLLDKFDQLCFELINLFQQTIQCGDLPANLLKGALKTVSKLFTFRDSFVRGLVRSSKKQRQIQKERAEAAEKSSNNQNQASINKLNQQPSGFRPGMFLRILFECHFDSHDAHLEEIILLTIQKIVIQIAQSMAEYLTGHEMIKSCEYFFRVLRKKALNDSGISTLHMSEATKNYMFRFFKIITQLQQPPSIPPFNSTQNANESTTSPKQSRSETVQDDTQGGSMRQQIREQSAKNGEESQQFKQNGTVDSQKDDQDLVKVEEETLCDEEENNQTSQKSPPNEQDTDGQEKDQNQIAHQNKYEKLKSDLLKLLARKLTKNVQRLDQAELNQSSAASVGMWRDYVTFLVKAVSEILSTIWYQTSQEETAKFILSHKELLMKIICQAGELNDLVVKIQTKNLFAILLPIIFAANLPMREELEILYVKVVLKPLEKLNEIVIDLDKEAALSMNQSTMSQQKSQQFGENEELESFCMSDSEDRRENLVENAQTQGGQAATQKSATLKFLSTDAKSKLKMEIEMEINSLVDLLVEIKIDHLAQMFLIYDCQPFSENIIRRSISILLSLATYLDQQNQIENESLIGETKAKQIGLVQQIIQILLQKSTSFIFKTSKVDKKLDHQLTKNQIREILKQKHEVNQMAQKANVKPKAFFKAINDSQMLLKGLQEMNPDENPEKIKAEIASKILLYSRKVGIDKIAEIIGGKDDLAKMTLEAYLDRQDYLDCNPEHSMRSFMKTFRMAGVESQVVFNILEKYGDKYFQKDQTNLFTSGEEAYNFAYLIIVLQTCQHNPAIKEKTSLERFQGQAKEMVPESIDRLPEGMVEDVFHKVTDCEIKAPVTRDLVDGNYDELCMPSELRTRLISALDTKGKKGGEKGATVNLCHDEFLKCSDLCEKQLFEYHNQILDVAPYALQQQVLSLLVDHLSSKAFKLLKSASLENKDQNNLKQSQQSSASISSQNIHLNLSKTLIEVNSHFGNHKWVDELILDLHEQVELRKANKLDSNQIEAELNGLFWSNFHNLQNSKGLIPRLAPKQLKNLFENHNLDQTLHETYAAVEVKIRNQFGQEIPQNGLQTYQLMRMAHEMEQGQIQQTNPYINQSSTQNSQTQAQTENSSSFVSSSSNGAKIHKQSQNLLASASKANQSTQNGQQQLSKQQNAQNSGIFNMVYNYFTPGTSDAQKEDLKRKEYVASGQAHLEILINQLEEVKFIFGSPLMTLKNQLSQSATSENVSEDYYNCQEEQMHEFPTIELIEESFADFNIQPIDLAIACFEFVTNNVDSREATQCLMLARSIFDMQSSNHSAFDLDMSIQLQFQHLKKVQELVVKIIGGQEQVSNLQEVDPLKRAESKSSDSRSQTTNNSDVASDSGDKLSTKSESGDNLQSSVTQDHNQIQSVDKKNSSTASMRRSHQRNDQRAEFDEDICLQINRHLLFEIYMVISMKIVEIEASGVETAVTDTRPTSNEIIKHVYKVLESLSEAVQNKQLNLKTDDNNLGEDIEQAFLYQILAKFLKPSLLSESFSHQIQTSNMLSRTNSGYGCSISSQQAETVPENDEQEVVQSGIYQSRQTNGQNKKIQQLLIENPKRTGKLLYRVLIFLMIQTSTKCCNKDQIALSVLQLLDGITDLHSAKEAIPYHEIDQCVDIANKFCSVLSRASQEDISAYFVRTLSVCDSIFFILEKHHAKLTQSNLGCQTNEVKSDLIVEDNPPQSFSKHHFNLWMKAMLLLQDKILLNPYLQLFKTVQDKACTLVKTQILTFQFMPITLGTSTVDSQQKLIVRSQTQEIFQKLLFCLSFSKISHYKMQLSELMGPERMQTGWVRQITSKWDDEIEGFTQLCQLCSNTITDVFIQFAQAQHISTLIQNQHTAIKVDQNENREEIEDQSEENQSQNQDNSDDISAEQLQDQLDNFQFFSDQWNQFMLVLLKYADEAEALVSEDPKLFHDLQPLQQSVQDNIQRVMEFLLSQSLLVQTLQENSGNENRQESQLEKEKWKLYQHTKKVLGLFWQEVTTVNHSQSLQS